MKRPQRLAMMAFGAMLSLMPVPALAQTATPPPSGEVFGTVVDQNNGNAVAGPLDVMLHIWDQSDVNINMLHSQSDGAGMFKFEAVDLNPQHRYGVMAVFEGVTYSSEVMPSEAGSDQLRLDVAVYETTSDLSAVEINQLHVLFNPVDDGLETTEIYLVSNSGDRTVKDAIRLDDGTLATLRHPLPTNADYIFFQPDDADRFVKFPGGFADTMPLFPGGGNDPYAVKYMVPYTAQQEYIYTAPVAIRSANLLLPHDSGFTLSGEGLAIPEPVTLENGISYAVYSYGQIRAGQTLRVEMSGKIKPRAAKPVNSALWLALGGGVLGLGLIGAGFIWRARLSGAGREAAPAIADTWPAQDALTKVIDQIAELYESHERGEVSEQRYERDRRRLLEQARKLQKSRQE